MVDGREGGAGDLALFADFDVLEDGAVHDAPLHFGAVAVDLVWAVDAAEGEVEGGLHILELGGRGALEAFGGAALGLELVLLGGEHVLGDEVSVVELDELFLLGLDRLQGAFVAFNLALDQPGAVGQLLA